VSLGFVPCVLYRIRLEEELLIREFGEEYIEYRKHTKKLVPCVY
jgi:protein-S-isoprenylcysteine O-methyltransferase Ste14